MQDIILDAILKEEELERQSAANISYGCLRQSSDYLVLSDGRLYSRKTRKFLTPKIDSSGYIKYAITTIRNERTKKMGIVVNAHRIVAETFIANPNNYPYVHHIDGNKLNNSVKNLQWVSAKQNTAEFLESGQKRSRKKKEKYIEDLPNEEWKEIRGYTNYLVSNMGRIRNIKTGFFVKPDRDKTARYARVTLVQDGIKKHHFVHRLVYSAFMNDYDYNGFVIDHIDSDTRNNKLSNLRKVTPSENNYARNKNN